MKYAFIVANQGHFKKRPMLGVHPRGFYVWTKESVSQRAREDERQNGLGNQAWKDSG